MKIVTFLLIILIPACIYTQSFNLVEVEAFAQNNYNSNSTSWVDYDNDGDLDLFVTNGELGQFNEFYQNIGNANFVSIKNNITEMDGYSFGAVWGDYDNDNDLDLFISNADYKNSYGARNYFFENKGDGVFESITNIKPVEDFDPSYVSTWVDYNNDGWLDLFSVNAYGWKDALYKNNGDKSFTKIEGPDMVEKASHHISCAWSDFDNDGDQDVLIVNADPFAGLKMYRNDGNDQFSEIVNSLTEQNFRAPRSVSWGDYNNDGWMDVVVVDREGEDMVFKNSNGQFSRLGSDKIQVSDDFSGNGSQWGDFDNDGDLDLVLSHHFDEKSEFHRNNGDGSFTRIDTEWNNQGDGFAWSISGVDVNQDGRLDIFQSNRFKGDGGGSGGYKNFLFLNNSEVCNRTLLVSLAGIESNSYGLGSKIFVHGTNSIGEEIVVKREMRCLSGGGYSTQNGLIAHFGMNNVESIKQITVEWSSGKKLIYEDFDQNNHLRLWEDGKVENLGSLNQITIEKTRSTSCPYHVKELVAKNAIGPVQWYKNTDQYSTETRIDVPNEDEIMQFVLEDMCENMDTINILNPILQGEMFPNPTNEIVRFAINGKSFEDRAYIRIFDMTGKFVQESQFDLTEGYNVYDLNVNHLTAGTYAVEIVSSCWSETKKLVKISL